MLAHSYARHVPAHIRVGRFVADEPRLAWVFPLLHKIPGADVLITGGTARDAVLGKVNRGVHVVVHGVPEHTLYNWSKAHSVPQDLDIKIPSNHVGKHHTLPVIHDLARRDATVNALAYSVRDGILHDPFDGLRDIEHKQLRAIGDAQKKFHEDPSRIARFLRLASELGFGIEEATWKALHTSSHKINRLVTDVHGKASFAIPRSHIGHEFLKALTAHPARALQLFSKSGVLAHTAPELLELHELERRDSSKAFTHLEEMLQVLYEERASTTVLLAAVLAIFEEGSLNLLKKLNHRLHLPLLDHRDFSFGDLSWLIEHRHVLEAMDPAAIAPAQFERVFGGERGDELLKLLRALYVTSKQHSEARERLYAAKRRKDEMESHIHPKLLRGRDLLSIGLQPGPHLRSIMQQVRDAQLSGTVHSKAEALDFARHLMTTNHIYS